MGDAGNFHGDFLDPVHQSRGSLQTRAVWQLRDAEDVALVLVGDKTAWHRFERHVGQDDDARVNEQHDRAEPNHDADGRAVESGERGKHGIEPAEKRGDGPVQ